MPELQGCPTTLRNLSWPPATEGAGPLRDGVGVSTQNFLGNTAFQPDQGTPFQLSTRVSHHHHHYHHTAYTLLPQKGPLTASQKRVHRDSGASGEGSEAPLVIGCGKHSAHGGRGPATAVHLLKLFYNIAGAFKIIPFLQNIPS